MRNYVDGGEAIVEAFRKLKVDYIMSSPGSEWSPVWEALTRQTVEKRPGPKFIESWHETLAVNMASGYTAITGRPQARYEALRSLNQPLRSRTFWSLATVNSPREPAM